MAATLHGILLWGVAYTEPGKPPWSESDDQVEYEDFHTRLKRRAERLGRDAEEAAGCLVGEHHDLDAPMYWLGIEASYRSCEDAHAERLAPLEVGDDWHARLKTFCEICDVPWQEPGWCLASLVVH